MARHLLGISRGHLLETPGSARRVAGSSREQEIEKVGLLLPRFGSDEEMPIKEQLALIEQ